RRVDLHALGPLGHQDLADFALVRRLHLHGGLVGLYFRDDVAGLDGLAFLDQPLRELALLHGGRQRGHQDLGRHALARYVDWVKRRADPTPVRIRRRVGSSLTLDPTYNSVSARGLAPATRSPSASTWPCVGRCAARATRPRTPRPPLRDP